MDRIRVIEELLWPQVPADVIEEAKQTAQAEPTWIAMEGNCHVVATVPPGSLDGATGDVIYIAVRRSRALARRPVVPSVIAMRAPRGVTTLPTVELWRRKRQRNRSSSTTARKTHTCSCSTSGTIEGFACEKGIAAAQLTGIGTFSDTVLGSFARRSL